MRQISFTFYLLSLFTVSGLLFYSPNAVTDAKNESATGDAVKFVTLKFFKGSVYAYNLDGEQRELKKNDKLYFGEILRTSADSLAVVKVVKGVQMKVEENSVVEVDNLYAKTQNKAERSEGGFFPSFFLHRGTVYGDVDKEREDKRDVKVRTKYVALGVRGTQFFVHLDRSSDSQYTAHVKRGKVEVASGQHKRLLENGNGTHLSPNGELAEATAFDWSDELNYNFDPAKGSLMTSKKVFAKIQKSYEEYAKRVRKKANSYFDSQRKKFEKMRPSGK